MLNMSCESGYWNRGFRYVVGVDEVGRGCLAGPVVAAAVSFPKKHRIIPGVNDSKKLSRHQRDSLDIQIRSFAADIGIGMVDANVIDTIGISAATSLAMKTACKSLHSQVILVDGLYKMELDSICNQVFPVVKGDQKIYSIAAASILAKVFRDNYMQKQSIVYPDYGFEANKGYGTPKHIKAIKSLGVTYLHRRSFLIKQLALD